MTKYIVLVGGARDGESLEVDEYMKFIVCNMVSENDVLFFDPGDQQVSVKYRTTGEYDEEGREIFLIETA